MNQVQREYKSNSFSLLLKEKKYALEVYNYLNNSHYTNEEDIQIVEFDGGIKLSVRNDSTFIVDGYVNLYEHQSTPNPNMPLRLLIYVAVFYKEYTKGKDLYGSTLIKIPTPKLVVFYNGEKSQPERTVMKLSDAFIQPMDDPMLELKCHFYNINSGSNEDLKHHCNSIAGYTQYVERVRKYAVSMVLEDAIRKAVEECIEEGILADFFKENKEMIISADAIDCTYERREQFLIKRLERELEEGLKEINQKLEKAQKEADQKIEKVQKEADQKIEKVQKEADQKIEKVQKEADQKLEEAQKEADQKLEEAQKEADQKLEEAQKEADQKAKVARIKEIVSSVKEGDYSKERGAQKLGISVSEFEILMSDPKYS